MAQHSYSLVYQCGIANVFRTDNRKPIPEVTRAMQSDFRACEWFLRGVMEAGAKASVWHCDEAGDIIQRTWKPGPGGIFRENKKPPYEADWALSEE